MPTIAYFLGIAIAMYHRDHNPPHIHVVYQGYTWPNGYDWDPIALHDEMKEAGELRPVRDAAE